MRFTARFSRTFEESGTLEFEAEDLEEAQEEARERLSVDDPEISWNTGEFQEESVESVTPSEE